MKFLESKWTSLACCCLNGVFAAQCFLTGNILVFLICMGFAGVCGYNFWNRMGEE